MTPVPVFILGILQRSGTNLLYHMLIQHPDCAPTRQRGEDYLTYGVEHLERYVDDVSAHWNRKWDARGARTESLARSLGSALVDHLRPDSDSPVFVTKTPSVQGIGSIARFVPDARVIALVRDGRDVAESGVRSFGWTYGGAFRRWAGAGEELVACLESPSAAGITLVRFEDLVKRPIPTLERVLEACGLDPAEVDLSAAADRPIYGSSEVRGGSVDVHWEPVPRPDGFDPVGRWSGWDGRLRYRYDRTCGAIAERLGYERDPLAEGPLRAAATRIAAAFDRR